MIYAIRSLAKTLGFTVDDVRYEHLRWTLAASVSDAVALASKSYRHKQIPRLQVIEVEDSGDPLLTPFGVVNAGDFPAPAKRLTAPERQAPKIAAQKASDDAVKQAEEAARVAAEAANGLIADAEEAKRIADEQAAKIRSEEAAKATQNVPTATPAQANK